MTRPLRLELAGGWYHLTGRGNERRAIFRDDRDRERFVGLVGKLEARYGLEVHGYVLMNNHYHLLVRLGRETGLSAAMQWLGVSYTVWFNRRHGRSGHLFQGRFKAILVQFEARGAEVSRYVHLNPVRVRKRGLGKSQVTARRRGLEPASDPAVIRERVRALRRYRWSSYQAYFGRGMAPGWLHREAVLERFGGENAGGQRAYRAYVEEVLGTGEIESPWEELKGTLLLGMDEWVAAVGRMVAGDRREQPGLRSLSPQPTWRMVREAVAAVKGEAWENFVDRRGDDGRDLALVLARRRTSLTHRQLADLVGNIDDSAVAHAVRRMERRLEKDAVTKERLRRAEEEMGWVRV